MRGALGGGSARIGLRRLRLAGRAKPRAACYSIDMKREPLHTVHAQYTCTFRPDPEGGYSVRCPAFPELIAHGDSLEEARAMAREALELCIEVYEEEGRPLPASDVDPRTMIKEIVLVKLARL